MDINTRINKINEVVKNYFEDHLSEVQILAKELMPEFVRAGIYEKDHRKGLPLRKDLRELDKNNQLHLIPFLYPERKKVNTKWYFIRSNAEISESVIQQKEVVKTRKSKSHKRSNSDEAYIIDMCDEVLGCIASRQHTFDFLLGDLHKDGISRTRLPVDAYYASLSLVIEFMEKQHTEGVTHFDKPNVMTISGVSRGEQRRIYDKRRRDLLPKHGLKIIEFDYSEFEHTSSKQLLRNRESDLGAIREKLGDYL